MSASRPKLLDFLTYNFLSNLKITLENTSIRFNNEWIFRHLGYIIESGTKTVILGGNGSGKSTLLQLLSGYLSPSEGKIQWQNINGEAFESDKIFRHVSLATPYLELLIKKLPSITCCPVYLIINKLGS
jgi:ABC-type transport system involved in cytochrome bd biosynthesis fused ATPase/permease subunit